MSEVVKLKVVQHDGQRDEDELREQLKTVLYQFDGRLTVCAALGVLHIVVNDFIKEQGL